VHRRTPKKGKKICMTKSVPKRRMLYDDDPHRPFLFFSSLKHVVKDERLFQVQSKKFLLRRTTLGQKNTKGEERGGMSV